MAEKCIELDSVEIAAAVFGNCDRNIRLLEKEFSVTAVCRGTQLRISGEPANVAAANRAVEGMLLLIENRTPLEDQTGTRWRGEAGKGADRGFCYCHGQGTPDSPQNAGTEGIPERHPLQCHYLRCRPGGYWQDLSGRCHGSEGLQG